MSEALKHYISQRVPLGGEAWEAYHSVLTYKQFKKKEHFLRENEVCRHIGFIEKGYVRLYYLVDGEEITKDFNFENSFCGSYASFLTQKPSMFSIVAMEDVELCLINHENLYGLIEEYPALQKLVRMQMEYMFIRKELREAAFLKDSAEKRYNDLLEQIPGIQQRVPLKYIASYLGIKPETLSRIRAK